MPVELIYSDLLRNVDGVKHCFTTRCGGVSKGHLASLNIGKSRGDSAYLLHENYRLIAEKVGFDYHNMATSSQVHGDVIRKVVKEEDPFAPAPIDCDALITNISGITLVVYTADCVPILLYDPVTSCVAAVHAGWRGTAESIVQKTVERLGYEYGTLPDDLICAIGPAIAQCCYEVGSEVYDDLCKSIPCSADYATSLNNKWYVDLKGINRALLIQSGVNADNISVDLHCTKCTPELFWSHRRDGDMRGLQGAMIALGD